MLFPIVDRELLVAARQQATYRLRAAAASAVMFVVAIVLLANQDRQVGSDLGMSVFRLVTMLAFGFSLLSGVFLTADCISEEKREGTLRLLFLTDLRTWDVGLGKLTAHSLGAVYALLTVFPVMGIPLLLGGVAPAEYGRVSLAILNALWLSLTAGLLISTVSLHQQKAIVGTLVLVMGLTGILPGLALSLIPGFFLLLGNPLLTGTGAWTEFWQWIAGNLGGANSKLLWLSPGYTFYLGFDSHFRMSPKAYWASLITCHVLAWVCLIATMCLLPRAVRAEGAATAAGRWGAWAPAFWKRWRQRRREKWLAKNPVFCLARRGTWPHVFTWTMVALVTVNVAWLTYGEGRLTTNPVFQRYFGNTIYFINRIWIAVLGCQFFLEARRHGSLELMLSTPLTVKTIVAGQWLALKRVLAWPVLIIGLLHGVYVMARYEMYVVRYNSLVGFQYHALAAAGSYVSFLADVFALSWVGMWLSLSLRKPAWAIVYTFVIVTVIPWLLLYFLPDFRVLVPTNPLTYYIGRPAIWLVKDLLFIGWAWWSLRYRFRRAAAQTLGRDGRRRGRGRDEAATPRLARVSA